MDTLSTDLPPVSHLYRQHRARALAIARRILHNADDAEDVVQDVFTKLCRGTVRFEGRSAWTTWLFRVMVNSSINHLRSRKRRATDEPDEVAMASHEPSPEQQAIGLELRRHFTDALEKVSEQHRQVLFLREVQGLSYPEIAERLGVPEGTVKSALNRGRTRIIGLMQQRESDSPA